MADSNPEKNTALAALTPPSAFVRSLPSGGVDVVVGGGMPSFAPGDVFADRYRMITRVGEGLTGEIWRADDLILQTTVAVKVLRATGDEERERFFHEVRLARQITHPAVCRVFDVGDVNGRPFYSMELVEGDDVAALLRRAGRFASEKVLDVAHQACGALAAAHAQGVLHRDLKPANILIDRRGQVRITDFGVAPAHERDATAADGERPRGPAHVSAHAYLAPEQRDGSCAPSAASDLYSLAVVLYELLTGRHPFADGETARVVKPSLLADSVHPGLERAILRALARDPRRRPVSAHMMAHLLDAPRDRAWSGSRVWLLGAGLAAAIGLLAVSSSWWSSRATPVLTDKDTIVVADFLNTTGEPVFDGALKVALAVGLEQSPFLKVYPDERIRESLRLMERSADEPVTRTVAREIARRDQLKAVVAGSIAKLGTHYVIALEALNVQTGDVMARQQVEASTKEDVLVSLGRAASNLRQTLGESLSSIAKFDVPLARATTSSLDALHAYSLALDDGRATPRAEAIPHLLRAIDLDPNFALAQALLSGVYWNMNRSTEAPVYSRRAFDLRDRVSERERFFISWRYFVDAAQAWDKALELAQSWTATYPREAMAFNSLAVAAGAFGRHDRGIAALREAIRLDPRFVTPYRNLAGSLIAVNQFDEAASAVREARAHGIDTPGVRRAAYNVALLRGDSAAMARELGDARATSDAGTATLEWEAQTAAYFGRFRVAHERFHQGVQELLSADLMEQAAQWTVEDAELYGLAGECNDARRQVSSALHLSRDTFTLQRAARTLAICGVSADVNGLATELAKRFPEAILTTAMQIPVALAALALEQGHAAKAVDLLAPVAQYDHAPSAEFWPAYLRGVAYLRLNDGASAAAQFQSILEHRGEAVTSPLYALAHAGAARAAMLRGDAAGSRRAYDTLFALWKDADPGLPPLVEARQDYGRLH